MKYLLLIILSFPLFSKAQDSCRLKKETDQFTHETRISTGFIPFDQSGLPLSISIDATKPEVDVFLWFRGGTFCFDETSTIQVLFEGGRLKGNYKNTGSMNCEGAFHFTFRNTSTTHAQLRRLGEKKVISFRITGNDKKVTEIKFTEEQMIQFQKMVNCIIPQAKTLL